MSHAISVVIVNGEPGLEIYPVLETYEHALLERDVTTQHLSRKLINGSSDDSSGKGLSEFYPYSTIRDAENIIRVLGRFGFYAEITEI